MRLTDCLIERLNKVETCVKGDWLFYKSQLINYIKTRKTDCLKDVNLDKYQHSIEIQRLIVDTKDSFYKKIWEKEWDRDAPPRLYRA